MKKRKKEIETCLICGSTSVQSRGLCAKHHSRFHRQMKALDPEQSQQFEQELMDRGMLLPRKSPGRKVLEDPFRDLVAELFVAESGENFEKGSPPAKKAKTNAKSGKKAPQKKSASRKKRNRD